jgi:hypothetical protein
MLKFGADYQLLKEGIAATDESVGSSRSATAKASQIDHAFLGKRRPCLCAT